MPAPSETSLAAERQREYRERDKLATRWASAFVPSDLIEKLIEGGLLPEDGATDKKSLGAALVEATRRRPPGDCGEPEDCRRDFHSACQLWGEGAYGVGNVSIWQLHTCLAQRARRGLAPGGNPALEAKLCTGALPGAVVPITVMTP